MLDARSWIYSEPFHSIYLKSTLAISIISNGSLLYVICLNTSVTVGSYRYLLAVFAICNILTNVAHTALQPILHFTQGGIFFFPQYGPWMIGGRSFDNLLLLFFVSNFLQTFLILSYHYVFRYKAMTMGITKSFTDKWKARHWAGAAFVVNLLYTIIAILAYGVGFAPTDESRAIGSPELIQVYGVDLRDPNRGCVVVGMRVRPHYCTLECISLFWLVDPKTGTGKWYAPPVIGMLLLFLLVAGTGVVIVVSIRRINAAFRSNNDHLSKTTKAMHLNLYHALLIQTIAPMTLSYAPVVPIMTLPVTGISLGTLGNVLILSTAIFPSVDAFFTLFFVRRFRLTVMAFLRITHNSSSIASSSGDRTEGTARHRSRIVA